MSRLYGHKIAYPFFVASAWTLEASRAPVSSRNKAVSKRSLMYFRLRLITSRGRDGIAWLARMAETGRTGIQNGTT